MYNLFISEDGLHLLNEEIYAKNWDEFLSNKGVDQTYDHFIAYLQDAHNRCLPVKKCVVRSKDIIRERWMTKGLLKSTKKCASLYKATIAQGKTSSKYQSYLQG